MIYKAVEVIWILTQWVSLAILRGPRGLKKGVSLPPSQGTPSKDKPHLS